MLKKCVKWVFLSKGRLQGALDCKTRKMEEWCSCLKICKWANESKRKNFESARKLAKTLLEDKVTFVYGQNLLFPVGNEENWKNGKNGRKIGENL